MIDRNIPQYIVFLMVGNVAAHKAQRNNTQARNNKMSGEYSLSVRSS